MYPFFPEGFAIGVSLLSIKFGILANDLLKLFRFRDMDKIGGTFRQSSASIRGLTNAKVLYFEFYRLSAVADAVSGATCRHCSAAVDKRCTQQSRGGTSKGIREGTLQVRQLRLRPGRGGACKRSV